ncbi:MAG: aldo/keto reductase [Arenicella sp.]|nr:aldo/keto reductase [Arenicella sp.]
MHKRILGQTGLEVSEVGFGAWQLGNYDAWGGMSDADALNLVATALDLGCNLFDTAPNYGNTNSERLLGEALKGQREKVVIVSKFGHRPEDGSADFSVKWFWESLHQSLKRLQTDYLDVMLLHAPPLEVLDGRHETWQAMRDAQQQGKIRFYGASTDYAHQVDILLETSDAQVLELLFNILHQDVRRSLDRVGEQNIGVIAKVPLDSGWLSGKYNSQSRFEGVRARWSENDIAVRANAVDHVRDILGSDAPLAGQALAYALSYDQVSAVIPGAGSIEQLQGNIAADGQRLSADIREQLESFWDDLTDHGRAPLPW